MLKPLTVWISTNCRKFLKIREYLPDHPTCLLRNLYAVQEATQTTDWLLEPGMEQLTGSKLGKDYVKAEYSHPAYLTYMQYTSGEMPGWMNHNLESRCLGEISTTSDMWMIPL